MRSRSRVVGTVLAGLVLVGCSDDGGGSGASPDEARTAVRDAAASLAAGLEAAGLRVTDDTGAFSSCGGGPEPQVEYGAGVGLEPEGSVEDAVDVGEQVLVDEGWEVDSSERGEQPYVVASDGAVTASVKASRIDEGVVVLEVQHACVADDADDRDFDDEPLDLS